MDNMDVSKECFKDFYDHRLTYENVDYIIHENGTTVFDSNNNIIGEYSTESEAIEAIREMTDYYA